MSAIGFNAWFGAGSEAAAWDMVDKTPVAQGFTKGELDRISGSIRYSGAAIPDLPISVGVHGPVANVSIYPIGASLRQAVGDESLRLLLRDLCDGTSALLGRTDTADMM